MLYRISKYDPVNYDENGVYLFPEEWTDFSDIGRDACTPKLTFEDYLHVENNYVATLFDIAAAKNVKFFTITQIEKYGKTRHWWKSKKRYPVSLICDFVSDCLRNRVWGVIRADGFICYPSWDFYFYAKCDIDKALIDSICASHSLYCTDFNETVWEDVIDWKPFKTKRRFYH